MTFVADPHKPVLRWRTLDIDVSLELEVDTSTDRDLDRAKLDRAEQVVASELADIFDTKVRCDIASSDVPF